MMIPVNTLIWDHHSRYDSVIPLSCLLGYIISQLIYNVKENILTQLFFLFTNEHKCAILISTKGVLKSENRISELIDALGITQTEFAKRLNISAPFVSQVRSGAREFSDRTIIDICREFRVNEQWLRTGDGDMFRPMSREQEIAAFAGDLLRSTEPDIRHRFILAISKLSVEQLERVAQVIQTIANALEDTTKDDPQ